MSTLSMKDVEYVAQLAHLELAPEAKERLLHELSDILAYIDKLNALDTAGVEPMMHAMEMTNVFREDVVAESLPREVALMNAPLHDDAYFLVPKILETEEV